MSRILPYLVIIFIVVLISAVLSIAALEAECSEPNKNCSDFNAYCEINGNFASCQCKPGFRNTMPTGNHSFIGPICKQGTGYTLHQNKDCTPHDYQQIEKASTPFYCMMFCNIDKDRCLGFTYHKQKCWLKDYKCSSTEMAFHSEADYYRIVD